MSASARSAASSIAYQLGFSPDGKWFVTAAYRLDHVDIYRYDGNFKLAGRIFIDGMPSHLAFDNDSKTVFVTLQQSAKVVAFDLQTQLIKWNAEVGKAPAGAVMLPDNKRLLVALTGEDRSSPWIRRTARSIGRLQTGKGAHNFWPKGDGRHWFLSNRVEGTVSLIDTQDMQVVATIRIPGGPDCMDITPDGKELWVTQRFLRRIAIVDLATMKVSGSIPTGKSPHGVFILKAPALTAAACRARRLERGGSEVGTAPMRELHRSLGRCPDLAVRDLRQPGAVLAQSHGMVRAGLQRRRILHAGRRSDPGDPAGHAPVRAPLGARKRGEERLIGVDRVYTLLNKLGIIPLLVFVAGLSDHQPDRASGAGAGLHAAAARTAGARPVRQRLPSFLVYFALYDFAAYWVHRAQHRFAWWWALHSLHHSQRRVTVWTDDRNHVLDDLLVNLVLAVFAQFVGVQPDDFVLILMVGRLIESWSHANVDMSFGRVGERLLVGPRFHRLHHALADAARAAYPRPQLRAGPARSGT